MSDSRVETWRRLIVGAQKSWVLFENGTCVILVEPEADLTAQALGLMRVWGPVSPGSPAGDFSVIAPHGDPGWVVAGHHPDILNYVAPDEVGNPDQLSIGLLGRAKRDRDAQELQVIHVEDKRAAEERAQ